MTNNTQVKVLFRLSQDQDGFPPFGYESVWAIDKGNGIFEIDNIPFFTREATFGDIISVTEQESELWFSHIISPSSNSLIRIIYFLEEEKDAIIDRLNSLGCDAEHFEEYSLIAVNIPLTTVLAEVQEVLQEGFSKDILDYEEAILRQ